MDMPWHVLMTISNAQTRKRHSVWICLRHVSMAISNVSTCLKHAKGMYLRYDSQISPFEKII